MKAYKKWLLGLCWILWVILAILIHFLYFEIGDTRFASITFGIWILLAVALVFTRKKLSSR